MKKVLLPICAMLLCMTACKKEESNGILRLEMEHYISDSKLHLDAAHFAVWDNNDEVILYSEYGDGRIFYQRKPVILSNGTATISDVIIADDIYAVYPSSWGQGSRFVTYPQFQFNHGGRVSAPMAALYDGEKLKFKNLGAILAVNVNTPMTVDSIEVISANNPISGAINIDYSQGCPTLDIINFSYGKNMTTLICDSVVTNSAIFYIALPPVNAQLTIKVYSGTVCYTMAQGSSHSLQANHGYIVNLSNFTSSTCEIPANNQIFYTAQNRINDAYFRNATGGIEVTSNDFNTNTKKGVVEFAQPITTIVGSSSAGYIRTCTSITLPASVTTLGDNAFKRCGPLLSINMPGVTTIGNNAFDGVQNLETIYMPKVESIGANAFNDCIRLIDVYCTRAMAPVVNSGAFTNVTDAKLHLPLSGYGTLNWTGWLGETYWDL